MNFTKTIPKFFQVNNVVELRVVFSVTFIVSTLFSLNSTLDTLFTGPEVTIEAEIPDIASISMTPPPNSFNYGEGNSESNSDIEYFFGHEHGSISRSTIQCRIYNIIVNIDESTLSLHDSFIDAIKRIDRGAFTYYVLPSDGGGG